MSMMLSVVVAMLGIEGIFWMLITNFKDSNDGFIKAWRYALIQLFILMIPLTINAVAIINQNDDIYTGSIDFLLNLGGWFWKAYYAYATLFIGYVFYWLANAWINHVDRK
jgi:hypothetical protein